MFREDVHSRMTMVYYNALGAKKKPKAKPNKKKK
jgi:hypothetical protein